MPMVQGKEAQKEILGYGILHEAWDIIRVLLISLAIVIPIRYFVAQPFIVRGASMEPNFKDRQYLIIDELSYFFRAPARHEVVVFRYPRDPSQFFIKRIIGLPGERIEIHDGKITIFNDEHRDGLPLRESYLVPEGKATHPDMMIVLSSNDYFVLGDNRDFSSDSRFWGPLNKKLVVGRALFRAYPLSKFGVISHY